MSFQMHVPRQMDIEVPQTRRRRRVKKVSETAPDILQQPITLSDSVLGIPSTVINSLPMEEPQPVTTVSRSAVNIHSVETDFIDVMHIIPDSRILIKRVKILGCTDTAAGIRVIDMETAEELLQDTLIDEQLGVLELTGFPETFANVLIIQANPDGETLKIPQVEIWAEIKPENE